MTLIDQILKMIINPVNHEMADRINQLTDIVRQLVIKTYQLEHQLRELKGLSNESDLSKTPVKQDEPSHTAVMNENK